MGTCGYHANIMFLQPKVRLGVSHRPQGEAPSPPCPALQPQHTGIWLCLSLQGPCRPLCLQLTPGSVPGTPVSSPRPWPTWSLRAARSQPRSGNRRSSPSPLPFSLAFSHPVLQGRPVYLHVDRLYPPTPGDGRCVRACCVRACAWGWGAGSRPGSPTGITRIKATGTWGS